MTVALEVWVMDIKTGRILRVQTRLLCRDCLGKWILKDVLEKCQMEMRYGLLETGGKVIFGAMKLAKLCEFCERNFQFISDQIGCLAEVISKLNNEDMLWVFLIAYSKMPEERLN